MYGCSPARAVVDPDGEDGEEQEEAGHAEAHLVDGRVAHQGFAVLSGIQLLAHLAVEGDLDDTKTPRLDHYRVEPAPSLPPPPCLSRTWPQEKKIGPNSIYWDRHASEGAE